MKILRDGENAVLVEPDSPERLAGGVRRVLNDRGFAERIAQGAFDDAAEYSWERRAERLERLLVLPSSSVGEESLSPNHSDTSSRF